jgi:hypothetical protein
MLKFILLWIWYWPWLDKGQRRQWKLVWQSRRKLYPYDITRMEADFVRRKFNGGIIQHPYPRIGIEYSNIEMQAVRNAFLTANEARANIMVLSQQWEIETNGKV